MRLQRDEETSDENKLRLAKAAAGMQQFRDGRTKEQKDVDKAKNAARMKAKRAADKAAKSENNSGNLGQAAFQRIQTPPRALEVTKHLSQSQEGRLPRRNDGTLSSGSGLNEDSMSEYEKLREQNILERQQKFRSLFGSTGPFSAKVAVSQTLRSELNEASTDIADPDFVANVETSTNRRTVPKRACTQNITESPNENISEEKSDLIPKVKLKRRKANLDRKSKVAKKTKKYREKETKSQYDVRLKVNRHYKRNLMKNENELQARRRKQVRQDQR